MVGVRMSYTMPGCHTADRVRYIQYVAQLQHSSRSVLQLRQRCVASQWMRLLIPYDALMPLMPLMH
jgi:hypothetical protein